MGQSHLDYPLEVEWDGIGRRVPSLLGLALHQADQLWMVLRDAVFLHAARIPRTGFAAYMYQG